MKDFAYSIYCISLNTYKFVRDVLHLPCKNTLITECQPSVLELQEKLTKIEGNYFQVHLYPPRSGMAKDKTRDCLQKKIIDASKDSAFWIKYCSVDGDFCYNLLFDNHFNTIHPTPSLFLRPK